MTSDEADASSLGRPSERSETHGSQHQPRRARRQPDPRPRAAPHAVRHGGLQPAHRGQHAPQGLDHRRVDREAELLRHHRLGQPGRELRPVPREGPARRRSTAASSGASGTRRTAPSARRSRSSPTPSSSSAAATAAAVAAAARAATSSCPRARRAVPTPTSRAPTTTFRSKESVLGTRRKIAIAAPRRHRQEAQRARRRTGGPGRRKSCFFCKSKVDEVDYKNVNELRRYVSEKGKIRTAASAARAGATSARSRSPSSAPARSPSSRTSATSSRAMEVILRQDVDKLGLRGEVVNVARGYARNFLLPRGLAEVATPALVKELEKRDAQRARHDAKTIDEARAIAARLESLELRFDVTAGPTGSLFGSVTATNVADRLWEQEKIRVDRRKLQMDDDQADRPLHGARRGLPGRDRRAEARRRARGRGAAARGGARRARGAGAALPQRPRRGRRAGRDRVRGRPEPAAEAEPRRPRTPGERRGSEPDARRPRSPSSSE